MSSWAFSLSFSVSGDTSVLEDVLVVISLINLSFPFSLPFLSGTLNIVLYLIELYFITRRVLGSWDISVDLRDKNLYPPGTCFLAVVGSNLASASDWPWTKHLNLSCLSFLISKVEVIVENAS